MPHNQPTRSSTLTSIFLILLLSAVSPSYAQAPETESSFQVFVELPGRFLRGVAYAQGDLYVLHSEIGGNGDVVRISRIRASDGLVLGESEEFGWNGRGVTVGAGYVWVADALADAIHRVNPTTLTETGSPFPTPGTEPNGLAFDGTDLWLTDPWFQKTYQLKTTGQLLHSFQIPNAFRTGLEWECAGMWETTAETEISRYLSDGTGVEVLSLSTLPSGTFVYDVAIGGGKLYVSAGSIIYERWRPQYPLGDGCTTPFITGEFGGNAYEFRGHLAEDYRASVGDHVLAFANGIICDFGEHENGGRGYGLWLLIHHPQYSVFSIYAHLSQTVPDAKVDPDKLIGKKVDAGELIGKSGNTGGVDEHLHFGILGDLDNSNKRICECHRSAGSHHGFISALKGHIPHVGWQWVKAYHGEEFDGTEFSFMESPSRGPNLTYYKPSEFIRERR